MTPGWSIDEVLLRLEGPPKRVVSLVPSYTQSFFDLGFGDKVVGVTDYCTHPVDQLEKIERVGGPMSLRVDIIQSLKPDLILANQEENERESVLALQEAGLNVWLSFPRSVKGIFTVLTDMVRIYGDASASMRLRMLETGFDWAVLAAAEQPRMRFFCPVWQETGPGKVPYWVTFNRDTYSSDLLEQLGGENIFADRIRRYPLEADVGLVSAEDGGSRDTRYPRVRREEILAAQPDIILLPDEPYLYDEIAETVVKDLLADTPAVQNGRVHRIDGRWIAWCGTCIGEAIVELPQFLTSSFEENL